MTNKDVTRNKLRANIAMILSNKYFRNKGYLYGPLSHRSDVLGTVEPRPKPKYLKTHLPACVCKTVRTVERASATTDSHSLQVLTKPEYGSVPPIGGTENQTTKLHFRESSKTQIRSFTSTVTGSKDSASSNVRRESRPSFTKSSSRYKKSIRGILKSLKSQNNSSRPEILNTGLSHKISRGKLGEPSKVMSVNRKLPGQIGDARLLIYAPLVYELLEREIPLKEIETYITKMVDFHDSLIKSRGVKQGTLRFKQITLYATQLSEGSQPEPLDYVSIGKKDRWPNGLGFLRPIFHKIRDYGLKKTETEMGLIVNYRRFLLTLFKINRVCAGYSELDISNIVTRVKLNPRTMDSFTKFVNERIESTVGIGCVKNLAESYATPLFGSANGPNGIPKEDSSYAEAYKICHADNKKLLDAMTLIESHMQEKSCFIEYLTECSFKYESFLLTGFNKDNNPHGIIPVKDIKLRKLVAVPDKGNKSRTVAISDFWTQSLLAPLEAQVILVTTQKFERESSYFDHSGGFFDANQRTDILDQLVSIDATDWTDNFPASLQKIVMRRLFGNEISQAWSDLAIDCAWHVGNTSQTVNYGKGQGMGTKGSFALAHLTNLLFISFIYEKHYPDITQPFFREVGDDMIIQDPKQIFAKEFEAIGVPINLSKTKRSAPFGTFVEFVSRSSWDGNDYSIISPNLMLKFSNNDYFALTLMEHLTERGVKTTLKDLFSYKDQYTLTVKQKPPEVVAKFSENRNKVFILAHLFNACGLTNIPIGLDSSTLNALLPGTALLQFLKGIAMLIPSLLCWKIESDKFDEVDIDFQASLLDCVVEIKTSGQSLCDLSMEFDWSVGYLKKALSCSNLVNLGSGVRIYDPEPPLIEVVKSPGLNLVEDKSGGTDHTSTYTVNTLYLKPLIEDIYKVLVCIENMKILVSYSIISKANTVPYLELMSKLNYTFTFQSIDEIDGIPSSFTYTRKGKVETYVIDDKSKRGMEPFRTLDIFKQLDELAKDGAKLVLVPDTGVVETTTGLLNGKGDPKDHLDHPVRD